MTAAAQVMFAAAFSIWLGVPAYLAGRMIRLHMDDRAEAKRRREQNRETTPEWLALLAAVDDPNPMLAHPSLHMNPSVARIRDRIAANQAASIDAEWEAMNS